MTFTKQYKAQSFPFQQHYSVSFWGSEQNVATNIYYSSKVPKAYWMALSILIHVLKLKSRFSQCSKQTSWFFRSNYPLTLSLHLYFPLRCFLYKLIKKGSSMGNHVECWPLSIHSWPWSTHSSLLSTHTEYCVYWPYNSLSTRSYWFEITVTV